MSQTIEKISQRIDSVDFLRGLVMIIMLLDHVRDYVHADAFRFSPTDLSKTSVILFFTRWITHFCAPTFVFLSGTSIYLQLLRGKSKVELSKFLVTRGLWLIFVEFTVIRFSMLFNLDYSFLGFAEVIWIFGVSMIVLAALIHLPLKLTAILGIAMIALHNLTDSFQIPPAVAFASTPPPDIWQKLWMLLHQPGVLPLTEGGTVKAFIAYPILPWIGVMAAGYALGAVYEWDAASRRKFLFTLGVALLALFVIIRATNVYGDPAPWSSQSTFAFTVLSFLNVTKYPVSLLFLLMTLGVSLLVLAGSEKLSKDNIFNRICLTYGRVPLFYFILQMFISHGFAVLLNRLAGVNTDFLFANFPDSAKAPPDAGFSLWVVYAAWLAGLMILYPLCLWYGKIKQRHRGFLLSYL